MTLPPTKVIGLKYVITGGGSGKPGGLDIKWYTSASGLCR